MWASRLRFNSLSLAAKEPIGTNIETIWLPGASIKLDYEAMLMFVG